MRGCARPRAKQVHKPGFRHNRSFGGTAASAIRVFDKPRSNSSANSAGSFDYAYDDYGNQRYRYLSADHTKFWRFTWDGENRLRRAELTLGGQVVRTLTFKYDPFGRRIEKKVEGLAPQVPVPLTTTYIYDGEDIVFTTVNDGTATTTSHYVHGPGIDEPLAMVANGQSTYYHADGLGSIVALTDASKNVVQRYGYDSFGMVTAENPEFGNFYAFTGREWDRELGLYYYRARYYDPMEGRFVSRDPIGFAGGDVNLYGYVGNNPINLRDPSGNIVGVDDAIIIGGGILVAGVISQHPAVQDSLADGTEALGDAAKSLIDSMSWRDDVDYGNWGWAQDNIGPLETTPGDPEEQRCQEVREECYEECVTSEIGCGGSKYDQGSSFRRCLSECLEVIVAIDLIHK